MVLLEFSVTPLGSGESVSAEVARCLEIVEQSGLDYQLHAMGTLIEGELHEVLRVLQQCVEAVASDHSRVTCSAKLDLRRGHRGRLQSKVASVEQQLGRRLKKTPGSDR
ncbi:MAG: MTH1187 family thiamine-binding protein [Pirellulales bacterium]|nr:MTH1187 family thiamine-binding protein [Pirellulales bacterium]